MADTKIIEEALDFGASSCRYHGTDFGFLGWEPWGPPRCDSCKEPWAVRRARGALAAVAAAESRGRAAGYAEAVQRLRDDERYTHWWSQLGPEHPEHRYWDFGRKQLADYLETVERLDVAAPSATTEEPTP